MGNVSLKERNDQLYSILETMKKQQKELIATNNPVYAKLQLLQIGYNWEKADKFYSYIMKEKNLTSEHLMSAINSVKDESESIAKQKVKNKNKS